MTTLNPTEIKARLKTLGLFGLLACCDEIADKPWLPEVLAIEERERQKRSLERRLRNSRVAAFKPMADFDWAWPKKIDREAVDELFTLSFVKTGHNAVLVGPNGVGKTMILSHVWGYSFDPNTNVVDVLVSRLRDKIDRSFETKLLHTVRGVGYVLRE